MLCVTGQESTVDALAQRLARTDHADRLNEIRLDALAADQDSALAVLQPYAPRLLVACRPERQGGQWQGAESERLALLRRAAALGVGYLDLEADLSDDALDQVTGDFSGKLILSAHDFSGRGPAPVTVLRQMNPRASVHKLAIAVEDACELTQFLDWRDSATQPAILIGMGPAGLLSRCRYAAFGSPWTYVAAEADVATAPGQLTLANAEQIGLPDSASQPFLCLIGGAQAIHSPGMRVYNSLFRQRELPWSYLTVITTRARETIHLVHRVGALGASVTMPHKQVVFELSQADELAQQVGAVNTVRFGEHGLQATNTDVIGVREPLRRAMALGRGRPLESVVILGGGGVARAVLAACALLRLRTAIAVIPEELERTRAMVDKSVEVHPWDKRTSLTSDVLINATPIAGQTSPWPANLPLNKQVVFDLALDAEPSSLLEHARKEGAYTIDAQEMWIDQGAAQMQWLTGKRFSAKQLGAWL